MTVAITGADLITSVGTGRADNFAALCAGVSGDKPLQSFDSTHFRLSRCYEIDDGRAGRQDVKGRASSWLCRCVAEASRQAGLALWSDRIALLVGTGLRELRSLELWWSEHVPIDVSELHFAGALRREVGFQGPVFTISNACSASNFALGLGADWIELGDIDVAIIAGTDSITESMLGVLDRSSPDPPERVQPFAVGRKGVLLGEGAAAVVLEPLDRVLQEGRVPLARLRGVGMSCDAHHETAPLLAGVVSAMVNAHRRAGITAEEVDLIVAHGTGTALNDPVEALAIKEVFGPAAERVMISGLKSMVGHTSGASGLMGVIVAIEAMHHGRVPPTVGSTEVIAEAEGLNIVGPREKSMRVRVAQVNAFGFGGVNAVAVVDREA